jgi:hypothetical protein
MKMYERRESGVAEYFKLATFDPRVMTWRDGKVQFDSESEARKAARRSGQYRVSRVADGHRMDLEPFTV